MNCINPKTGRKIKCKGPTYQKLIKAGYTAFQLKAKSSSKRPKSKKKTKTKDTRGCTYQTRAKYHAPTRRSPSYPANQCCGQIMEGNDGNMYLSKADKRGICRWQLLKT